MTGVTSACSSSWWWSLEHPPQGTPLQRGASTCNSAWDLWPDLKSSVSPNELEFVADILNINDPVTLMNHSQLCSDAGAAPRRSRSTAAMPSTVCSGCSHEHFLFSLCLSWHEKQLCPYFPHQRIKTVTQDESETEKGNNYSDWTASTPQLLHPAVSFTSTSLWHCHPMNPRQMHEQALDLQKHVHKLPKNPAKNWLHLCRRKMEQRDLSAKPLTILVSQTSCKYFTSMHFLSHETKAPCTWKTGKPQSIFHLGKTIKLQK